MGIRKGFLIAGLALAGLLLACCCAIRTANGLPGQIIVLLIAEIYKAFVN